MPYYNLYYNESYSGHFVVEADSPEKAQAIFRDKLHHNCEFSDFISDNVAVDETISIVNSTPLTPDQLDKLGAPITESWGE